MLHLYIYILYSYIGNNTSHENIWRQKRSSKKQLTLQKFSTIIKSDKQLLFMVIKRRAGRYFNNNVNDFLSLTFLYLPLREYASNTAIFYAYCITALNI